MPELPEVETVRRDLQESVVGLTVMSARVFRSDVLCDTRPCDLEQALAGRRIEATDRLGKNLILRFSGGPALIVNLGMTGQFYVAEGGGEPPEHTHVVLELSDGARLLFRDMRRFGHVELVADGQVGESTSLQNVGVDACARAFTAGKLVALLAGRTGLLKSALMDQSLVAGLGNIYACEVMHRAGLSPRLRCHRLSEEQIKSLHRAIKQVLSSAIKAQGTTLSDDGYVTGRNLPGGFQRRLRVYGREGEPCRCPGCGHEIRRIVQANRSTFYCPGCQGD